MPGLEKQKCIPCSGDQPKLPTEEVEKLMQELDGWTAAANHHLSKDFHFKDFKSALEFVNEIGDIAEEQNHHPEIFLTWGKVNVQVWTHAIGGLHKNDFILAKKIDHIAA